MKSALYREFATDKTLEVSGVWVRITEEPNEDGTFPEFLVGRAGGRNTRYKRALDRISEPFRAEIENNTLSAEQRDKIEAAICVEGVLIDWRNVQDGDGNAISFDGGDVAISLLTEMGDARQRINLKASRIDEFRLHRRVSSAKN